MRFVAVDVEKLNRDRDSICAIAIVEITDGRETGRRTCALRPPSLATRFPWSPCAPRSVLASLPTFADERDWIERALTRADFVAAHNASYDLTALAHAFRTAGGQLPPLDYLCTLQLARRFLPLDHNALPDVCDYLGIELDHHNALSDARACAEIVIKVGPTAARTMLRRCQPRALPMRRRRRAA